jgi:heme-degrading monooxygenase HmoA
MITEHAVLPVIPGQEAEFMEAMDRAKAIIASAPGFISLRVGRCIERPAFFLLLVEWETLEAHTEGFRSSRRPTRSGAPYCTTSTTRSPSSSTSTWWPLPRQALA